ncbi:unnamed protein product [Penicillium discolor]
MSSYKDEPPDQEYLGSIKKHTDKETNKVNLALVGKDFGYTSGKSFQKKYAKLKKAHNLTNGHIYGDYRPGRLSTQTTTPEVPTYEVSTPEAATTKATRTLPKDTLTPEVKGHLRGYLQLWHQALKERDEEEQNSKERDAIKKDKNSEKKKKKKKEKSYILPGKTKSKVFDMGTFYW